MNRAIQQAVALQTAIESSGSPSTGLKKLQAELAILVIKLESLKAVVKDTTISLIAVPIARCDQLCYHITNFISGRSSGIGTAKWTLQDMTSLLLGYCATISVGLEHGIRKANLPHQESDDEFDRLIQLAKERLSNESSRMDGANENSHGIACKTTSDREAIWDCLKICEDAELYALSFKGTTKPLCSPNRPLPKCDGATEAEGLVPDLHEKSKDKLHESDSFTPGCPSPRDSVELTPKRLARPNVFRVGTAIASHGSVQLIVQTRNGVMVVESAQVTNSSQFVGFCEETTVQEVLKHRRERGAKDG